LSNTKRQRRVEQPAVSGSARGRLEEGRRWLPHPQAVQAVFFDVGFTLLDPYPSVPAVVRDTLERRGTPVELACLEAAAPAAEAMFVQLAREDPLTWSDEQAITRIWYRYFLEMLRPCLGADEEALAEGARAVQQAFDEATSYAPYPDVQPALHALHQRGLKLGVISDWGVALSVILRHFELTQYFDFTVVSATARRAKPDPALYQLAVERADVAPDYALHIGDSYIRDVLGARAVGIKPILIDRARMLSEGVPDCPLVYDLFELLDLLEIPRPVEGE
jgi:putative hydrolase of the HAD superfamily